MVNDMSGRDNFAIGRRLIATRKAYDMNQRTFATFCGIGPTTLNNFERGRQRPSIETNGKISAAIGAKLEWVWNGDRDALPPWLALKIFADKIPSRKKA